MLYSQSIVRGALFILASEFLLASSGALIKWLAVDVPNEMIVFFRNLFGLLALLPLLALNRRLSMRTTVLPLHLIRGLIGLAAMYCFYYAIGHIKLADAMLLKLTTPILIPVIAWFWLKERLTPRSTAALFVGFAGVVFILKPGGDFNWVVLIAIAGSAFAAVAKVTIRRLSRTEPAVRTVFYFAAIGAIGSALPLVWAWHTPNATQWLWLILLGPLTSAAQWCMTRGYAAAPASQVGIFTYSAVLFGAGYGWWFWGELWDVISIFGASLVAIAGAMALRSQPSKATTDSGL